MKTDMSPRAITDRLRRTSELRRLCLALGKAKRIKAEEASGKGDGHTPQPVAESHHGHLEDETGHSVDR